MTTLTAADLQHLAETAEERAKGYLREALKDPGVKAAVHSDLLLKLGAKIMDCPAISVGPSTDQFFALLNDRTPGWEARRHQRDIEFLTQTQGEQP